jgi:hypothetical protein
MNSEDLDQGNYVTLTNRFQICSCMLRMVLRIVPYPSPIPTIMGRFQIYLGATGMRDDFTHTHGPTAPFPLKSG